ncbi:ABC-type glycerol-3-phosphate transport system substrate-binding protein [Nakamurella sp. UYEF19]|uniref:extracellular solute-binding protein n=1 Tax=Nakamurella sp. UYEF19 TaxID=1756392 RepID=UPI003399FFB7
MTITVSNKPPASSPGDLKAFEQRIKDFQAANPNVTVNGSEIAWDPQTFAAQLAGGQLPTVVTVPFTEPQSMIQNKQISDITADLKTIGLYDQLNPAALSVTQDKAGEVYGIPIGGYALGLVYNRALFTKAGLDPDKPPTTWDEVRAAAKTISQKTGAAGYAQMTQNNTGGWMYGATVYSRGGTLESSDGSKAAFDDQSGKDALDALTQMRWTDNSMGTTFLYDMTSISKDFAADKIGMFIGAPVNYILAVVQDGMKPASFGLGTMPQGSTAGGSMSGGAVQVISPKATADQRLAGVKWIAFSLESSLDQAKAVAAAKLTASQGLPVGLPGVSTLKATNDQEYLGWVKSYINVPLTNFATYSATVNSIKLTPEPSNKAQEVYAKLDALVQKILTDKSADVATELSNTSSAVNSLLGR